MRTPCECEALLEWVRSEAHPYFKALANYAGRCPWAGCKAANAINAITALPPREDGPGSYEPLI